MSEQTYALAKSGVFGQSNGVYTNALSAIPDSGVGRWTYEDDSDNTVAVDVWYDHDFTLNGGPTYTTDAFEGSLALSFDAADDYGERTTVTDFEVASVSVYTSFKRDGIGTDNEALVSKQQNRNNNWPSYLLNMKSDGTIEWLTSSDGSNNVGVSTSSAYDDGVYHEALGTYDDTNDEMELYIDGTSVGTASQSGIGYNGDPLYIGRWRDGAPLLYGGLLDDTRIHNKAITPSDI